MAASHMIRASLWNILMMVNKEENNICTLQVATESNPNNNNNISEVLDVSIDMMLKYAMPVVLVERSEMTRDYRDESRFIQHGGVQVSTR